MPDAHRKRGQRARTRRRLAIVGLSLFVVVDLALVAFALTREPDGLAADADTSAPSAPVASSSTPTTTPTVTATPAPAAEAAPLNRMISAVDGTTAWRAETGACTPDAESTPATLQTTNSAGAGWISTEVTSDAGVAGVDRLQATEAATVFVVGPAGSSCETAFAQTFTSGAAFGDYPDRLDASWYVPRSDRSVVHAPFSEQAAPCPAVVDLAVVSDTQAAVLCSDRTLFRTTDAASSWDAGTVVEGAVAIAADSGRFVVASTGVDGCDGTRVATTGSTADDVMKPAGCSAVTSDEPGSVAVSAASGSVWLWAGDDVVVSIDGGVTW